MSFRKGAYVTDGTIAGIVIDNRRNPELGHEETCVAYIKVGKLDENPLREGETHHAYGDEPQQEEGAAEPPKDTREKIRLTADRTWMASETLRDVSTALLPPGDTYAEMSFEDTTETK